MARPRTSRSLLPRLGGQIAAGEHRLLLAAAALATGIVVARLSLSLVALIPTVAANLLTAR